MKNLKSKEKLIQMWLREGVGPNVQRLYASLQGGGKTMGKGCLMSISIHTFFVLLNFRFSFLIENSIFPLPPPTSFTVAQCFEIISDWAFQFQKTLRFSRNVLSSHSIGLMQNRKCMKNEILLQKECNIMLPSLTSSISKNGLTIQFIPPALIIFQLPTLSSCTSFCKRSLVLLA